MADMPADFWSGWIILLSVVSFSGLVWLVLSVYFRRAGPERGQVTGEDPVWDENLHEGDNPAPFWWFWLLLAAMVFSVLYLMFYPGLGSYAGALKWSQGGQFAEHQDRFQAEFAAPRAALAGQDGAALAADRAAMAVAANLFQEHCAACHGKAARGQAALFPDLRDGDWQWGGTAEQIEQTIRQGRNAVMPGWQRVLAATDLQAVGEFVGGLSAGAGADHPGRPVFQQYCAACHGASGEGNPLLGAPRLNDAIWLYGGTPEAIAATVAAGRNGQMPAFAGRLDAMQIRLLVAWLAFPQEPGSGTP
ncbi:MAG TPA: cytochrome-c oxidase, cbb3-type subunit III [Porticoccaceae bacterium]|nr:cytochrome-c oxidase, cbb3-type subunit III [Porticoccaceae bacterium]